MNNVPAMQVSVYGFEYYILPNLDLATKDKRPQWFWVRMDQGWQGYDGGCKCKPVQVQDDGLLEARSVGQGAE